MASRKGFLSKVSSMFASSSSELEGKAVEADMELDEAEVWNWNLSNSNNSVTESKKWSRSDWSKILKENYEEHENRDSVSGDDDDDDGGGERVPPHEYLARNRGASLSVHEGKGRTLKGRDLRSVRNAIWKKIGFED
ncbi:hypothetical protein VIGAN_04329000 [Vigna angularis var. angularis]|uniref:Senescence regulator S40 n=1 Tax=Vigna angularis var. angularis TaxID=157739 RepID=A0A0S3RYW2_PHAAN|nr:hypothetical protein VIGAN_04329000 [Vigna angularis var. angularis]